MISDREYYARRDGLKVEVGLRHGRKHVDIHIPCAKCGNIMVKSMYNPEKVYLCDYCKRAEDSKKKIAFESEYDGIRTRKEMQFDKAVETLRGVSDKDYSKAIVLAERRAEQYGSIPEAMTAIVLVHNGHRVIPQQPIGRYKVDFCLPDYKIIIEVDGELYHADNNKVLERDAAIQYAIGLDWEIIHLPAEMVRKKPDKIIKAINAILQHRGKK